MKTNVVMVYLWSDLHGFVVYISDVLCLPGLA